MSLGIEAAGLIREFKAVRAVAGIDLAVADGEIYGFLGPNGAGKSTTVHMLTTLLPPTAGTARVAGFDVVREGPQVRASIGAALQEAALDPLLTGREHLRLQASLQALPRDVRKVRAHLNDVDRLQVRRWLRQLDGRAAIRSLDIHAAVERAEVRGADGFAARVHGLEAEDDEGARLALLHADDARARGKAIAFARQAMHDNPALRQGLNIACGKVVLDAIAELYELPLCPVEALVEGVRA